MATATTHKAPRLFEAALNTAYGTAVLTAMLASGYTYDPDSHVFVDTVTGEITGTGYTAGGKAVPNGAVTYDTAADTTRITGDPVTWDNSTITADRVIWYLNTGTPATSPIVAVWEVAEQSSSATPFVVTPNAAGVAAVA